MNDQVRETQAASRRAALLRRRLQGRGATAFEGLLRSGARPGEPVPLSFGQWRLWFVQQLDPSSPEYLVPLTLRLRGRLSQPALAGALRDVVARHEVLRGRFLLLGEEPKQLVAPVAPVALPVIDLTGLREAERERRAAALAARERRRPIDLERGPLLRAALLRTRPEEHVLVVTAHHIAVDGWSMGILARELGELYSACVEGRAAELPPLAFQYGDFAAWERERLTGERRERLVDHWRRKLEGLVPLEVPGDRQRPPLRSPDGATVPFDVPADVAAALRTAARAVGGTLFMALLAGFQATLVRFGAGRDVAVAAPVAGRARPELEGLIGFFVNTVVLRTDLRGDPAFVDLVGRVRDVCLDAYAHQELPFATLVDELQPARDQSRSPFTQVSFAMHAAPASRPAMAGLEVDEVSVEGETSKLDLSLEVEERADGSLAARLQYATAIFERPTVARIAESCRQLLQQVGVAPGTRLSGVEALPDVDRLRIVRWNSTATAYPDRCLHELIADQAAATPGAVAIEAGERSLTFRDLQLDAGQIAAHLRTLGVRPNTPVAVSMEPSAQLVTALLAVLQAGGAYVPLDPAYPADRLAFMLADSRAAVVLTDGTARDRLPETSAAVVCLDRDRRTIAAVAGPGPSRVDPSDLVYVIYTSGSTGRPKGAMNTHRAIVNRLLWMRDALDVGPRDAVLLKTSTSFDVSVWELFLPLLSGARLVVARAGGNREPAYLAQLIAERGVSLVHFVPSMLRLFLDVAEADPAVAADLARAGALRCVVCSGEALSHDLRTRLAALRPDIELHNVYGPTEAAVDVTAHRCPADAELEGGGTVPIGLPVSNTRTYVVDVDLNAVPVGVPGELCVGGVQLARGYLGRPGATAERFVPDPFGDGGRLYRTGDLVRQRASGDLEFLGRLDHQVKIRGFRVEPGEVEEALREHPELRGVVVQARESGEGDRRLVAYVVARGNRKPSTSELREWAGERLPEHLVPSAYVLLEELPLLPNGKVDRSGLPEPEGERPELRGAYVGPRTETERLLSEVWGEVLGIERVGVHDDFFDLGGDSILMLRMASRARLRGLDVVTRHLLEQRTVARLAAALDGSRLDAGRGRTGAGGATVRALLWLKRDGHEAPLFCVHPGGGSAHWYLPLAERMDAARPVAAFEAPGISGEAPPIRRVEEMARLYVAEMRDAQPRGPYHLLGWCGGSGVAVEMAYLLHAAGAAVAPLLLVDPSVDAGTRADFLRTESLFGECERLFALLRDAGEGEARVLSGRILALLGQAGVEVAEDDLSGLPTRVLVWRALARSLIDYQYRPYPGRVRLIVGDACWDGTHSVVSGRSFEQYRARWADLALGGLTVHRVPGDHLGIWKEPHVATLRDTVKRLLATGVPLADAGM